MKRSSFVRKGASSGSDLGSRPGLHGQTLISSGLAELDKILGGGMPLGSLLLVLEDGNSRHHATLLRYFLGEGEACRQMVMLAAATEPSGGLSQFIPQQLKRAGAAAKEEEPEAQDQEQYTLRIAWQYRRYLRPAATRSQAGRANRAHPGGLATSAAAGSPPQGASTDISGKIRFQGADSQDMNAANETGVAGGKKVRIAAPTSSGAPGRLKDWCHQFDLSRGLGDEALAQSKAAFLACRGRQAPARLVSGAIGFVQSLDRSSAASIDAGSAPTATREAEGGEEAVALHRHSQLGLPQQQQAQGLERDHCAADPSAAFYPRKTLPPLTPPLLRHAQEVGRLAVLSLGSPDWWDGQGWQQANDDPSPQFETGLGGDSWGERQVLLTLTQLKAAMRERRCAAVVTVPAALHSAASVARMAHLADAVLALEGVADDSDIARLAPDSASVSGLLHVRKLPSLGAMASPTPEVALYLIRNKRRRLSITPVEIDPDAEANLAEGAANGAGTAAGSAAGLLCGGAAIGGSSTLDF